MVRTSAPPLPVTEGSVQGSGCIPASRPQRQPLQRRPWARTVLSRRRSHTLGIPCLPPQPSTPRRRAHRLHFLYQRRRLAAKSANDTVPSGARGATGGPRRPDGVSAQRRRPLRRQERLRTVVGQRPPMAAVAIFLYQEVHDVWPSLRIETTMPRHLPALALLDPSLFLSTIASVPRIRLWRVVKGRVQLRGVCPRAWERW